MAKTLYLRRVPEGLRLTLMKRAAARRQSLSEYIVRILNDAIAEASIAEGPEPEVAGDRAGGVTTEDIVAIIRRARDA